MRNDALTLRSRIVLALVALTVGGFATFEATEAPREAKVPEDIPESARETKNPVAASPESVAGGQLIYSSQCAMCHGTAGKGDGDLATRFKYEIPDFTTADAQRARTDGEWFYILTHGHGKMTGEGERLSEKVRWDLVNFLRSLGPGGGS